VDKILAISLPNFQQTTRRYSDILNPSQIPANPPTAVKIIDEKDSKPAPHKLGINPPMVEPTNIPTQMSEFEFIQNIISKNHTDRPLAREKI